MLWCAGSCLGCHQDTKITEREKKLAKFAVNHPDFLTSFAAPTSVCEEEIIPEIMKVKTQVVAGTNYIMHLQFPIKHGKSCDQKTIAVCHKVTVHKPLPHECREDENSTGCAQLINLDDITCTLAKDGGAKAKKSVQNASLISGLIININLLVGLLSCTILVQAVCSGIRKRSWPLLTLTLALSSFIFFLHPPRGF